MTGSSRCGPCATPDGGSASVWMLAVGLVLLAAGLTAAALGAAHVARHQAQSAADLGALAGAPHTITAPRTACARAAAVVEANGARLVACHRHGADLTVTVEVTAAVGPVRPATATATARAGPVRAADSPAAAMSPPPAPGGS